jgi:hypothetical protein
MCSRTIKFWFVATVGMFLFVGSAQAIPLSELFQGLTITADDKLFSEWTLEGIDVVNGGVVDPTIIDVTPLEDDPNNPGVKFTTTIGGIGTPFNHIGPSSAKLHFSFRVETTDGRPLIKDNSLLINGFIFDASQDATIRITEMIEDESGNPLGDKGVLAESDDFPNSGDPDHFDSAEFEPQSVVIVHKWIDVQGPGDFDGAFLTMFEQRFSQLVSTPGDGNGDGWVDGLDYLLWAGAYGTHPGPDGDPSDGDYNDDGWVDGLDYLLWAGNYGTHSATAVPEPTTLTTVLLAVIVALSPPRRRGC